MDEISQLEARINTALDTLNGAASHVSQRGDSGQEHGGNQSRIEDLQAEIQERSNQLDQLTDSIAELTRERDDARHQYKVAQDRIGEMSQKITAIKAQLAEGEAKLRQAEDQRKQDLAELDDIIEQIEPLLQGSN